MSAIPPSIPFPQVAKFIGQLNHDLRNHLNAIELQSAFLGEIVAAEEAKAEVRRLRDMTGEMGAQLQRLSRQLAKIQVHTMSYTAADLGEDLRAKINTDFSAEAAQLEWQFSLGKETVEIDPQLLLDAFAELFANAFTHSRGEGPVIFTGRAQEPAIVFSLREPKSAAVEATADWGRQPLARLRHGHYGLGLFRARSIFEAHHGTYEAQFDPTASVLTTTIALPLSG